MSFVDDRNEDYVSAKLAFDRIVFFSDAVFAIAMTVLVLDLVREYVPPTDTCPIYCQLQAVSSLMVGYTITFGVLGMQWAAHHQIFRSICRHDFRLIVFNLVHLAFTVAVPFTAFIWGPTLSSLLDPSRSTLLREAATVYAGNLFLSALALCLLWFYASHRNRLTFPGRVHQRGRYYTARLVIPTALFGLCVVIAQWLPALADILLVLTWLMSVFLLRRFLAWTHRFDYLLTGHQHHPVRA